MHVDATHLITNLTAVLPDCVMLEQQCGSAALAADVLLLTTTSHALYGEQRAACARMAQQAKQQLLPAQAVFLGYAPNAGCVLHCSALLAYWVCATCCPMQTTVALVG